MTHPIDSQQQKRLERLQREVLDARVAALAVLEETANIEDIIIALDLGGAATLDADLADLMPGQGAANYLRELGEAMNTLVPRLGKYAAFFYMAGWRRTRTVGDYRTEVSLRIAAEAWRDVVRAVHKSRQVGGAA